MKDLELDKTLSKLFEKAYSKIEKELNDMFKGKLVCFTGFNLESKTWDRMAFIVNKIKPPSLGDSQIYFIDNKGKSFTVYTVDIVTIFE